MRISRFAWALALSLGFTLIPTILIAQPAPANTVGKNLHTKRHARHAPVAIAATGALPAAERLLIRACAQSTSATTDHGISLDSASKQSARANLVERSTHEALPRRSSTVQRFSRPLDGIGEMGFTRASVELCSSAESALETGVRR
jgi:hypothetical protein